MDAAHQWRRGERYHRGDRLRAHAAGDRDPDPVDQPGHRGHARAHACLRADRARDDAASAAQSATSRCSRGACCGASASCRSCSWRAPSASSSMPSSAASRSRLARTMVVNTIVVMEIFYLFSVRYIHGPSLTWQGVLGTPAVLIGVRGGGRAVRLHLCPVHARRCSRRSRSRRSTER